MCSGIDLPPFKAIQPTVARSDSSTLVHFLSPSFADTYTNPFDKRVQYVERYLRKTLVPPRAFSVAPLPVRCTHQEWRSEASDDFV